MAENDGKKLSKARAGYSGGMTKAHCALCRHFEPPNACEYIAGHIDPQAWCRYFERKKG